MRVFHNSKVYSFHMPTTKKEILKFLDEHYVKYYPLYKKPKWELIPTKQLKAIYVRLRIRMEDCHGKETQVGEEKNCAQAECQLELRF